MRGIPANGTLNDGCIFAHGKALGTGKGPVSLFTAHFAKLVFLEGTIQECQLAKLLLLVDILLVVNDLKR